MYSPNISKFILSKESRRYTCPVYYALNAVIQVSFKHRKSLNISKISGSSNFDHIHVNMYAKSFPARMISLFQEGNKTVSDVM